MSLRDCELIEAIRRDDLAYVMSTRYEKPLEALILDDMPTIVLSIPSPIMVAAFFGSTKCFNFFINEDKLDYLDGEVYFLFFIKFHF